jgi:predicted ArsR family transcriptional regulator
MPFTPNLAGLKALAQPRRLQILERLATHGPATSAMLARDLDLNTGATSYHLRELARHGFVAEDAGAAAHGRERWWRAVERDLRFPARSDQDGETRAVVDHMHRLGFAADLRQFAAAREAADALGPWQDAFPYARGTVRVTLAELHELFEAYIALQTRFKRPADEAPPGARTVLTRFLAFPAP